MSPGALRSLARIAKRDARRSPGRSLLVTALVALPVAGLVMGMILVRSTTPTAEQVARWNLGRADLVVEAVPAGVDLGQRLPAGARVATVDATFAQVELPGERLAASLRALPLGDPLLDGMLQLDRGRAPSGPGEVAASGSVLDAAGIDIGGTLHLAEPDLDLLVTGTVLEPQNVRGATLALAPGALDALATGDDHGGAIAEQRRWLVSLDGDNPADVATRLRADHDLVATTRAELTYVPTGPAPVSAVFVLGGLALFEAALMAGAAFAVGARRQTRTLGLVAAAGGERRHLAGVVLMGGVVLGAVGAGAGIVLGLAASLALAPSLDRLTGTMLEGLVVPPLQVAGAGLLGLAAAVAAAWLPARSVARIPPATALAGRRPISRSRPYVTVLGLLVAVAGCGLAWNGASAVGSEAGAMLVVVGAIAVVAGFAACSPTLVGLLGHLAPRLSTSLRLAVRDAARHRTRVGPAVAAVMAALSMPVAVATYTASADAQARSLYVPALRDDQLLVATAGHDPDALREAGEAIAESVPDTVAGPIARATVPDPAGDRINAVEASLGNVFVLAHRPDRHDGQPFTPLTLGSADLLRAYGGEEALAAFEEGKVVALGTDLVEDSTLRVATGSDNPSCTPPVAPCGGPSSVSPPLVLPAVEVDVPRTWTDPTFVISLERAIELGFQPGAAEQWLLRTPEPIDDETLEQVRGLAAELGVFVQAEEGFRTGNSLLSAVALAFSTVIALSVVAIATALSAAESRNDLMTLAAVGAAPRIRRRFRATQAGVLAVLGGFLAVPAGLLPAFMVLVARDTTDHLVLPWGAMAAATLAVPLLAAGAAALSSRAPRAGLTRRLA